ncbi:MAG: hypothetical protein ABJ360_10275 [Roseobacter sp.]
MPIKKAASAIAHLVSAGAGLTYAWFVSQSALMQTGLQFIAPVLVIMLVHLIWLTLSGDLSPGFSNVVFRRCAQTAIGMAATIFLASMVAPQPANAAGSDIVMVAATVVFCVAVIAIVGGLVALIFYGIFKGVSAAFKKSDANDPESRLYDFGSLTSAGILLVFFSLEGHPESYAFDGHNTVTAIQLIDAAPDQVWRTMETATSPDFPLPSILSSFPRPTQVIVDEGTDLGAMRQVEFAGREGSGSLTLQVTDRTDASATFTVLSDTSPYADWVSHQSIIYRAIPEEGGTRLSVTLNYERRLAPAWFFSPVTQGATFLAANVLARDVKARAES